MSSDATHGVVGTDAGPPTGPNPAETAARPDTAVPVGRRAALLRQRVEVQALRQRVEAERRRRQQIVDQYESLLADRPADTSESRESGGIGELLAGVRRRLTSRRR